MADVLKSVGLQDKEDIVNRHLALLIGAEVSYLQKLDALATSNERRTYDGYEGKWVSMLEDMNINDQSARAFEQAVRQLVCLQPLRVLAILNASVFTLTPFNALT